MDPATNAMIGLLFLAVGAVATFLMYYLRGRSVEKAAPPPVCRKNLLTAAKQTV